MSGNESVVEEIVELGIEIVHPGGRPGELREAATQWRQLKAEVDHIFGTLDKQVDSTVGHTWRGPAAEAFHEHWNQCVKAADLVTEHFDEAAAGLEKAAKAIEEVNEEIEDIYLEIGISVGVSIGMSFVTFGVSAAVGTARVAMLAERALNAASMLGRMLRAIAHAYKAFKNTSKFTEVVANLLSSFALNATTGTAGGMATSLLSGNGFEFENNLRGGIAGATFGTGATSAAARLGAGEVISGVAGGAAGGVGGDALNSLIGGDKFDARQAGIDAVTGGAAGGAGGTTRSVDRGLRNIADDLRGTHTPESHDAARDTAWGTVVPIAGGVSANDGKDGLEDVDAHNKSVQSGAGQGTRGRDASATDEVRHVFG
ncbi:WXG100 family type VII secretion target [Streptomyces sp. NPDC001904]|uniref:WXG100 family type VII secretion target n=1 Tax=Streptomyces sp. NPDC001904 TaxID=3154531 RepID=UPI00332AEFC2